MSLLTPDSEAAQRLRREKLTAVLVIEDDSHAVPLARALLAGGIGAMELTLRTPAALPALRHIRSEVPEMFVGAGTILTPEQVDAAAGAGAAFGVAPGMNPRIIRHAADAGLAFAPGVATPTDIDRAIDEGCRVLKFFPAEGSGGIAYLRQIAAPVAHLGIGFLPLGGIGPENLADYLACDPVIAVGGSWLAPRDAIAAGDWNRIEAIAREARSAAD